VFPRYSSSSLVFLAETKMMVVLGVGREDENDTIVVTTNTSSTTKSHSALSNKQLSTGFSKYRWTFYWMTDGTADFLQEQQPETTIRMISSATVVWTPWRLNCNSLTSKPTQSTARESETRKK
jgi:hypothetical protein